MNLLTFDQMGMIAKRRALQLVRSPCLVETACPNSGMPYLKVCSSDSIYTSLKVAVKEKTSTYQPFRQLPRLCLQRNAAFVSLLGKQSRQLAHQLCRPNGRRGRASHLVKYELGRQE